MQSIISQAKLEVKARESGSATRPVTITVRDVSGIPFAAEGDTPYSVQVGPVNLSCPETDNDNLLDLLKHDELEISIYINDELAFVGYAEAPYGLSEINLSRTYSLTVKPRIMDRTVDITDARTNGNYPYIFTSEAVELVLDAAGVSADDQVIGRPELVFDSPVPQVINRATVDLADADVSYTTSRKVSNTVEIGDYQYIGIGEYVVAYKAYAWYKVARFGSVYEVRALAVDGTDLVCRLFYDDEMFDETITPAPSLDDWTVIERSTATGYRFYADGYEVESFASRWRTYGGIGDDVYWAIQSIGHAPPQSTKEGGVPDIWPRGEGELERNADAGSYTICVDSISDPDEIGLSPGNLISITGHNAEHLGEILNVELFSDGIYIYYLVMVEKRTEHFHGADETVYFYAPSEYMTPNILLTRYDKLHIRYENENQIGGRFEIIPPNAIKRIDDSDIINQFYKPVSVETTDKEIDIPYPGWYSFISEGVLEVSTDETFADLPRRFYLDVPVYTPVPRVNDWRGAHPILERYKSISITRLERAGSLVSWAAWDYYAGITITPDTNLPSGYTISVNINTPISEGESDYSDIRILYLSGSAYTEIDRDIRDIGEGELCYFALQGALTSASTTDYIVVWGNSSPPPVMNDRDNVYLLWNECGDINDFYNITGVWTSSGTRLIAPADNQARTVLDEMAGTPDVIVYGLANRKGLPFAGLTIRSDRTIATTSCELYDIDAGNLRLIGHSVAYPHADDSDHIIKVKMVGDNYDAWCSPVGVPITGPPLDSKVNATWSDHEYFGFWTHVSLDSEYDNLYVIKAVANDPTVAIGGRQTVVPYTTILTANGRIETDGDYVVYEDFLYDVQSNVITNLTFNRWDGSALRMLYRYRKNTDYAGDPEVFLTGNVKYYNGTIYGCGRQVEREFLPLHSRIIGAANPRDANEDVPDDANVKGVTILVLEGDLTDYLESGQAVKVGGDTTHEPGGRECVIIQVDSGYRQFAATRDMARTDISFHHTDDWTGHIQTADGDFTALFTVDETIRVSGSANNDGSWKIKSVSSHLLGIWSGEMVYEEAGAEITITAVDSGDLVKCENMDWQFDGEWDGNIGYSGYVTWIMITPTEGEGEGGTVGGGTESLSKRTKAPYCGNYVWFENRRIERAALIEYDTNEENDPLTLTELTLNTDYEHEAANRQARERAGAVGVEPKLLDDEDWTFGNVYKLEHEPDVSTIEVYRGGIALNVENRSAYNDVPEPALDTCYVVENKGTDRVETWLYVKGEVRAKYDYYPDVEITAIWELDGTVYFADSDGYIYDTAGTEYGNAGGVIESVCETDDAVFYITREGLFGYFGTEPPAVAVDFGGEDTAVGFLGALTRQALTTCYEFAGKIYYATALTAEPSAWALTQVDLDEALAPVAVEINGVRGGDVKAIDGIESLRASYATDALSEVLADEIFEAVENRRKVLLTAKAENPQSILGTVEHRGITYKILGITISGSGTENALALTGEVIGVAGELAGMKVGMKCR